MAVSCFEIAEAHSFSMPRAVVGSSFFFLSGALATAWGLAFLTLAATGGLAGLGLVVFIVARAAGALAAFGFAFAVAFVAGDFVGCGPAGFALRATRGVGVGAGAAAFVCAAFGFGVVSGVPGRGYSFVVSVGTETLGSDRSDGSAPRRLICPSGVGETS